MPTSELGATDWRTILSAGFVIPVILGVGVWLTVGGLFKGDYYRCALGVCAMISFSALGVQLFEVSRRCTVPTPDMGSVSVDGRGVAIRVYRPMVISGSLAMGFMGLGSIMLGLGLRTGWGQLAPTAGQVLIFSIVLLPFGFALLVIVLTAMIRSMGEAVLITSRAIRVMGVFSSFEIDWASVDRVVIPHRAGSSRRGYIEVVRKHVGSRMVRADRLGLGLPAMFWLLDFYSRNPELREELADQRVLGRLRDGSLIDRPGWISRA